MPRRRVVPREHRAVRQESERVEFRSDGSWNVRSTRGSSTKAYRCPGCEQLIRPATAHVVIWPVQKALLSESAIEDRRHWHTACWARRH